MNSPILICGCPGSGTSLVTKILRHAGLFVGGDAGPAEARKYHESQCFKQYNMRFLASTIDFSHAPKSAEQFKLHNSKMQRQLTDLARIVNREHLLSAYWGSDGSDSSNQPCGWKDPRNSATALIWKEVFPDLRAIVIRKRWRWRDRWKTGGSDSGNWYRKQSTADLRGLYQNPIGLDPSLVLRVDVDQLTTDSKCLADVLGWCKLSCESSDDFKEFMARVGVER